MTKARAFVLADQLDQQQFCYLPCSLGQSKQVALRIETNHAGWFDVPLLHRVRASETDKPALHCCVTHFNRSIAGKKQSLRSGWLYLYAQGYLWREFQVNSLGQYQEVNLRKHQKKHQRPAEGVAEQGIVLPTDNGKQPLELAAAYSEVQWSLLRINYFGGIHPIYQATHFPGRFKQQYAKRFVSLDLCRQQTEPVVLPDPLGSLQEKLKELNQAWDHYINFIAGLHQDPYYLQARLVAMLYEQPIKDTLLEQARSELDFNLIYQHLKRDEKLKHYASIRALQKQYLALLEDQTSISVLAGLKDYFACESARYQLGFVVFFSSLEKILMDPSQLLTPGESCQPQAAMQYLRKLFLNKHPLHVCLFPNKQSQSIGIEAGDGVFRSRDFEKAYRFEQTGHSQVWASLRKPTLKLLDKSLAMFIRAAQQAWRRQRQQTKAYTLILDLAKATGQPLLQEAVVAAVNQQHPDQMILDQKILSISDVSPQSSMKQRSQAKSNKQISSMVKSSLNKTPALIPIYDRFNRVIAYLPRHASWQNRGVRWLLEQSKGVQAAQQSPRYAQLRAQVVLIPKRNYQTWHRHGRQSISLVLLALELWNLEQLLRDLIDGQLASAADLTVEITSQLLSLTQATINSMRSLLGEDSINELLAKNQISKRFALDNIQWLKRLGFDMPPLVLLGSVLSLGSLCFSTVDLYQSYLLKNYGLFLGESVSWLGGTLATASFLGTMLSGESAALNLLSFCAPWGWFSAAICLMGVVIEVSFADQPFLQWAKNGPFGLNNPHRPTSRYQYADLLTFLITPRVTLKQIAGGQIRCTIDLPLFVPSQDELQCLATWRAELLDLSGLAKPTCWTHQLPTIPQAIQQRRDRKTGQVKQMIYDFKVAVEQVKLDWTHIRSKQWRFAVKVRLLVGEKPLIIPHCTEKKQTVTLTERDRASIYHREPGWITAACFCFE